MAGQMRQPGMQQQILKYADTISQTLVRVQCRLDGRQTLAQRQRVGTGDGQVGAQAQGLGLAVGAVGGGQCQLSLLTGERQLILMQRQLCTQTVQVAVAAVAAPAGGQLQVLRQRIPVAASELPLGPAQCRTPALVRGVRQAGIGQQGLQELPRLILSVHALQRHCQSQSAVSFALPVVKRAGLLHGAAKTGLGAGEITLRERGIGLVVVAQGQLGGRGAGGQRLAAAQQQAE